MIRITEAGTENRSLLWELLQEYLREMSQYYELELDEKGDYRYRYFDAYFAERERKPLLIYEDRQLVGFVLLNAHSYIGAEPDHVLAEFGILPEFRQRHIGTRAAEHILQRFPGRWEIKYSEKNVNAKKLWNRIAAPYNPAVHGCEDGETVLAFEATI